ncbi:transcriptional regulation of mitochondrial recombination-domain-containing protein [Hypoxylon sp. FL1150]|nr:transcriptional regulation of mitochondrial recombination-domain-containing protein [Hypoxylon sp. FL1150]
MALRPNSITAQLAKLSLGIRRGGIRFNSTDTKEVKREKRRKEIEASQFQPHHGEKIWIFTHFLEGFTAYSHSPVMKAMKVLRQLPFTGKKLKPSKLRKDYWGPMAMIQFPEGCGDVGRSVYQLLRECKSLHELSWGDHMFYDKDGSPRSKHERGRKLNDQKANTIADMAAVLGGRGKGNKIRKSVSQDPADITQVEASSENNTKEDAKGADNLVKAEVWWVNEQDRNYAKRWPANVTHHLFKEAMLEELSPVKNAKEQTAPAELVAEQELQEGAGREDHGLDTSGHKKE